MVRENIAKLNRSIFMTLAFIGSIAWILAIFVTEDAYAATRITSGETLAQIAQGEYDSTANHQQGGEKYWRWGGESHEVQWCSYFASWCAHKAGLMDAGIFPTDRKIFRNAEHITAFYRDNHPSKGTVWKNDGTYIPCPGDLAMTVNESGPEKGQASHSAIVVSYRNGRVNTIGGNGEYSRIKANSQPLGKLWAYFITPAYSQVNALSISKAKVAGYKDKIYDGSNKYQSLNDITVSVGGRVLESEKYGLSLSYYETYYDSNGVSIPNAYRRPTEGKGIGFFIVGRGLSCGATNSMRYKITAVKTYFLRKTTKNGNDYRFTINSSTKKKFISSGYTLSSTMNTRLFSKKPVYEYYNPTLKLHRFTYDNSIGKRLVKCGYKKGSIVAYSDPTVYKDDAGKLYAAYYAFNSLKTDNKKFQNCATSWDYGSLKRADRDRAGAKEYRLSEIIEYVSPVTRY